MRLLLLCFVMVVADVNDAHAFRAETHRGVSEVAALRPDVVVDEYLRDGLGYPRGLATVIDELTLRDVFADGSVDEDVPIYNVLNHFYDPVRDAALDDALMRWVPPSFAPRVDSLTWGWGHPENEFDWQAARRDYRESIEAVTEPERRLALRSVFRTLGHITHLVQDLAQPQHSRNDAHFFLSGEEDSQFEAWVEREVGRERLQDLPVSPLPNFDTSRIAHPTVPAEFVAFWDTNQYTASGIAGGGGFQGSPGLAEYAAANFVTDDTMFSGRDIVFVVATNVRRFFQLRLFGPGFDRQPNQRFLFPDIRHSNIANLIAPPGSALYVAPNAGPWRGYDFAFLNRFGAAREGDPVAGDEPLTVVTPAGSSTASVWREPGGRLINVGLTDADWVTRSTDVLPRAISYTAGLLNYFFRGRVLAEPLNRAGSDQPVRLSLPQGTEELKAGEWGVLVDDDSGFRSRAVVNMPAPQPMGTGDSFVGTYQPPEGHCGDVTILFRGTIGNEEEIAVATTQLAGNPRFEGHWVADLFTAGTVGETGCAETCLLEPSHRVNRLVKLVMDASMDRESGAYVCNLQRVREDGSLNVTSCSDVPGGPVLRGDCRVDRIGLSLGTPGFEHEDLNDLRVFTSNDGGDVIAGSTATGFFCAGPGGDICFESTPVLMHRTGPPSGGF